MTQRSMWSAEHPKGSHAMAVIRGFDRAKLSRHRLYIYVWLPYTGNPDHCDGSRCFDAFV